MENMLTIQELRTALLEAQAVFDNAWIGILYTRERRFRSCNARAAEILGYAVEDLIGQPASVIFADAESYDRIGIEATPLLGTGMPFESEWQFKRKDGALVWCHVWAKAVDPVYNLEGTVWILEDISAAKAMQDELKLALREFEAMMNNASVAILHTADRKVMRHNPKFAEMFGYRGGEALGMPGRNLYPSDEAYAELGRIAGPALSQGKPFQHELYLRRKDGSPFWVNLIGYVPDPQNPTRGTIWIIEDRQAAKEADEALRRNLVELKETNDKLEAAQNQLLQSEKLASIGQLAAGVAHEINNPIGFVNSNVTTLGKYIEGLLGLVAAYEAALGRSEVPDEVRQRVRDAQQRTDIEFLRTDIVDLLRECVDGLARVRQIVQDLKDFSRVDSGEWQYADLNACFRSTLNVVRNEIKYKAEVEDQLGELPAVMCNAQQINQVLMNLLVNAAHAIESKGRITIRSGVDGELVWLEVEDNGHGMTADVKRRIFEPFFTTKPVGKGTGLGLSVSYGIVAKHGGHFDVDTAPGRGTRFRLWLPTAGSAEGPAA